MNTKAPKSAETDTKTTNVKAADTEPTDTSTTETPSAGSSEAPTASVSKETPVADSKPNANQQVLCAAAANRICDKSCPIVMSLVSTLTYVLQTFGEDHWV